MYKSEKIIINYLIYKRNLPLKLFSKKKKKCKNYFVIYKKNNNYYNLNIQFLILLFFRNHYPNHHNPIN